MGHIENPDWMRIFDLERRFGDARECPQIGQGVEIDTRVGPMYLTRQLFSADHFIHTHVTEMREGYLHRMVDRLFKPFGMGYTRLETRSAYHFGYGPRTGQLVARAVFDSDFIQRRTSPPWYSTPAPKEYSTSTPTTTSNDSISGWPPTLSGITPY